MKRTNILKIVPKKEEENILFELADNSSRMYNEINYKRRQSFFSHNLDWNTDEEYHKYKKIIGSATAQQLINKNRTTGKRILRILNTHPLRLI